MGKNRPRWVFAATSLWAINAVVVTVYPTLTPEEVGFVLFDSGARIVVVDTVEQAEKVLSVLKGLPELEAIYVMDDDVKSVHEKVFSYDDLLASGKDKVELESLYAIAEATHPDDGAALIYTSGTTGLPKGVMLTHANFLSQRACTRTFAFSSEDVFLNHLPFSHAFGMTTDLLCTIDVEATMAIAEGMAPEQIRHALTSIRPTVLMSVPRLFEKLYVQVQLVLEEKPAKVRNLVERALDVGKEVFDLKNESKKVPFSLMLKHRLFQRILAKVKRQAGLDRVRVAFAGGGPTSAELCGFFQSLGIDIYQGYGLTETSPIANVNLPGKNKLGTVGPPIEGVEEQIAGDGEILIRGPNVMKGYYNDPQATAEAIGEEGWFHTGDIGKIDEEGYLTIVDRKKEILITSSGKNIAPLKIETAFNTDSMVARVVVVGDGRKYLSALVCPDFERVKAWAGERGIEAKADAELASHEAVIDLMAKRVEEVNRTLPSFEQIKRIAVMDHEFSEATGELTPTLKVKRRVVEMRYKSEIDSLYDG